MIDYSNKYDPIMQLKTGPITQYWITDAEGILAEDLYNKEECSGRSQLKEPAFGGEFLFLTRDLIKARVSLLYIHVYIRYYTLYL